MQYSMKKYEQEYKLPLLETSVAWKTKLIFYAKDNFVLTKSF